MTRIIKTIFLIALLIPAVNSYAQKTKPATDYYFNKTFDGNRMVDTTKATPAQWRGIREQQRIKRLTKERFYFNPLGKQRLGVRFDTINKSTLYEGLRRFNGRFMYTTNIISGKSYVELIAQDITPENAKDYLYKVMQGDELLVSYQTPSVFRKSKDGVSTYAYLGKFGYHPNQVLQVEIFHKKNYADQDALTLDWRPIEAAKVDSWMQYLMPKFPAPGDILFSHNFNERKRTTDRRPVYENKKIVFKDVPYNDMIETTDTNDVKFRLSDTIQNLRFDIENGKRLYNYQVSLKRTVDGQTDSLRVGETNDEFILFKEYWKKPGTYEVIFTPKIGQPGGLHIQLLNKLATTVKFTTLAPLNEERKVSEKTLALIVLIILTTGGFMFMMYRDKQKRRLAAEAQNRQVTALKLQSVRAQLNPHFIFNALAGIQNLMNKNAIEDANKYLSKFARLTRNVLDDSGKELIPIEKEAALLADYLQMEQMRFGFNYDIDVEKDLDRQIEIPGMLLQPFAENAVKHGVSALKDKGMIWVSIGRAGNSLVLAVKDNGPGFSPAKTGGMGIKLCEDRIRLLNEVYKNTRIVLHILSDNDGTLITIELQKWL